MLQEQVCPQNRVIINQVLTHLFNESFQIYRDEFNVRAELERELACVVSTYERRINTMKPTFNLQIQQGHDEWPQRLSGL